MRLILLLLASCTAMAQLKIPYDSLKAIEAYRILNKKETAPIRKEMARKSIYEREQRLFKANAKYKVVISYPRFSGNEYDHRVAFTDSDVLVQLSTIRNYDKANKPIYTSDNVLLTLENMTASQKAEVVFVPMERFETRVLSRIDWGYEGDRLMYVEIYCKILSVKILN